MVLDAIFDGKFLPHEMHMTYTDRHKQANEEIGSIRTALKHRLSKEDFELVERLSEQILITCSTDLSDGFKYGFSAGILLLQEARSLMEQQGLL